MGLLLIYHIKPFGQDKDGLTHRLYHFSAVLLEDPSVLTIFHIKKSDHFNENSLWKYNIDITNSFS